MRPLTSLFVSVLFFFLFLFFVICIYIFDALALEIILIWLLDMLFSARCYVLAVIDLSTCHFSCSPFVCLTTWTLGRTRKKPRPKSYQAK